MSIRSSVLPCAAIGSRWRAALAALALFAACRSSTPTEAPPPAVPPPAPTASVPAASASPSAPPVPSATAEDRAAPVARATDVAVGRRGAVTTAEKHATAVGRAVLEKGGNAVDAAVAVGFALSVTHPWAGPIAGGGFMVIRFPDGRSTAIDFREVGPGKATRDMYLDDKGQPTKDSLHGPRAAGIPGDVAGFAMAHKKYGTLPWKELVAPAVALARDGHELDEVHADDLKDAVEQVEKYRAEVEATADKNPALIAALVETAAIMSGPGGAPLGAGDRFSQPALADTLQAIADRGAPAFYRGPLANKLVAGVKKMGGIWTTADLAKYRPIERKPIVFEYRGHQLITMPPPSAGGVLLRQVFAASDALGLYKMPWDSVDRIHFYVEALRRVYADRNLLIGDPAFVDIPMKTLLEAKYMVQRMASVSRERATPSSEVGAGVELKDKTETTHYSIVDEKGIAVATTFTLNAPFGALVMVPGTGVLLNNEMDDFTVKVGAANMYGLVQGPQNAIAAGKRMLSSMTPTIVAAGGKLRAVCGTPGGSTITTTVAQIVLQVIDHGRPIEEAIAATRIHHQWLPDMIIHENGLDPAIAAALQARGHKLMSRGRIGHAHCIERDPKSGDLRAVADTGRHGGDADAF